MPDLDTGFSLNKAEQQGLDRGRVEYQAEDQGRRLANTVQVKRSEVGAGRGPRTMFSEGPDHPPLNVNLRRPHSKISAMGLEFLATALRAIMVSGQSTVDHLVFTPILSFP